MRPTGSGKRLTIWMPALTRVRGKGKESLDVGPFAEWLKENYPDNEGLIDLARRAGVDHALLRRIVRGKYISHGRTYSVKGISVDYVDRILVADGNVTSIASLYPQDE